MHACASLSRRGRQCDPWHRDEHCGTLRRSSVFVEGWKWRQENGGSYIWGHGLSVRPKFIFGCGLLIPSGLRSILLVHRSYREINPFS